MDRLTHAQVGGPYASRDDAERAIERGGFDQSSAELTVEEVDDGGSREAAVRTGAAVPKADGIDQKPESLEPQGQPGAEPEPDLAADLPDGMEPGDEPGLPGSDVGEAGIGADFPEGPNPTSVLPMTTKPAQMPSGGPPPMGGSMLTPPPGNPPMPGDVAFDPGGLSAGADPVATGINNVAVLVAAQNPGMDEASIRRVARNVVGRLVALGDFDPLSMTPSIEDPLAHRSPFLKFKKKEHQGNPEGPDPEHDDSELPESQEVLDPPEPGRQATSSSLPRLPV